MASNLNDLARAIARAAREHGTPNGISPGELHQDFGAPAPMMIGKLIRQQPFALKRMLKRDYGLVLTGYAATSYGMRIGFDALEAQMGENP